MTQERRTQPQGLASACGAATRILCWQVGFLKGCILQVHDTCGWKFIRVTVLKTGGMDYHSVLTKFKTSFIFSNLVCTVSGGRSTQQKKPIQRAHSTSDCDRQRTWVVELQETQKGNSHVIMANHRCSRSLALLDWFWKLVPPQGTIQSSVDIWFYLDIFTPYLIIAL